MTRRRTINRWVTGFLAALLFAIASPASAGQERRLRVGEESPISARDVRSYSVGASGIVDVRVPKDPSWLVLVGRKPGTTNLLLVRKDGSKVQLTIRVVPAAR